MHEKILDQYTSDLGGVILAYAKDELESMPYSVRFNVDRKLGFKLFWTLIAASDYFQEVKFSIQSK